MNPQDFLNYVIPLLSRKKQEKLLAVRKETLALKELQHASTKVLGALMPAILDRAFRGEL